MKKIYGKILTFFLMIMLVFGLQSGGSAVYAAGEEVAYIDADGTQKTVVAEVLDGSETILVSGWYVAKGTLDFTDTITIDGDVHIILADGCEMDVTASGSDAGINVSEATSLTIYAQSGGTGALTVSGGQGSAGIGSDWLIDCGSITITGGNITAQGGYGLMDGGAGIGSGIAGFGGNITISGGNVVATGGNNGYAAGIGGGALGTSGNIIITGNANVTATGSGRSFMGGGAGIGSGGSGGDFASEPSSVDSILIDTTGTVIATGGPASDLCGAGAAIGYGGYDNDGNDYYINGHPNDVTVVGGQDAMFEILTAYGSDESVPYACQWEVSINNGLEWTNVSEATNETLTLKRVSVDMSGNLYRCVIKDANDVDITVVSHPALLTVTQPKLYAVIEQPKTFDGKGDRTAKIDASHENYSYLLVLLDGKFVDLDDDAFTITEGSTVITLKESYIKTLKNGTYTFRAYFDDGYAEFKLTVKVASKSSSTGNPKTGDNGSTTWVIVGAWSLLGLWGVIILKKRKIKTSE